MEDMKLEPMSLDEAEAILGESEMEHDEPVLLEYDDAVRILEGGGIE